MSVHINCKIAILFEAENLNTLENKNEFTLGVMSLVAQGESEQKKRCCHMVHH
jgi:lipid-binding SYLF domain-containing protein